MGEFGQGGEGVGHFNELQTDHILLLLLDLTSFFHHLLVVINRG